MAMVLAVLVLMCSLVFDHAQAATHTVGGHAGWSPDSLSAFPFPEGTSIKAGDVLYFKYDNTRHNVAKVGKWGYANCKAPAKGAHILQSGEDRVRLEKAGQYYFICSLGDGCLLHGMHLNVTVY